MKYEKRDINQPYDYIGQLLNIGDTVIHTTISSQKAYFEFGVVEEIFPVDKRDSWYDSFQIGVRKPGNSKISRIFAHKLIKSHIDISNIKIMCGNPRSNWGIEE